jgi:hypothetical protein
MRRLSLLPTLLFASATWFAAGPGGVTLRAMAACWHHQSAHTQHGEHAQQIPPGSPCFCDQMTGGNDVVASPELPTPVALSELMTAVVQHVPFPLPPSPFPGFSPTPIPPPPNPLA